jgi:hypothetical protein
MIDTKRTNAIDEYSRAMEILADAAHKAVDEGITLRGFLPAVGDFTAAIAISVAGEKGMRAFIGRLRDRIEDWYDGTFPGAPSKEEDKEEKNNVS